MKVLAVLALFLSLLPSYLFGKYPSYVISSPSLKCSHSELISGPQKVNLIELYTSEGCSSCPPKDRWLNDLIKSPQLFKSFVPLKFHVDYWNYLGHKDPFSKNQYTERQYDYGQQWSNHVIYTPNFVLNGKEWFGEGVFESSSQKVGIIKVKKLSSTKFRVNFLPLKKYKSITLYGTILGNGFVNKIKIGENIGKTLTHNFVVLDLKKVNMKKRKNSFQNTLELNLDENFNPQSLSYAFWVASNESLNPIQVTGGCFK